jgi:large subunit ribosomal protein L4
MSSKVLTTADAAKSLALVEEEGKGNHAVHEVVVAMRAARRTGSANSKTKAEVSGSDNKPWRQKGTGRARAGNAKSPIWVGGGVVFGPKPRDYSKTITKKARKLALRRVLTDRIAAEDLLLVDDFKIESGKTRDFVAAVRENSGIEDKRVAIIADEFDEVTRRAARNAAEMTLILAKDANVEQLLRFKKLIVTKKGLEVLGERTQ